jgi:glycosyltransferase involved in cell wall biosynthesis
MRVSVCIPVYNRSIQVLDAIQSALDQTIDGLDVLVIDNCSDDGTWQAICAIQDPRLRVMRNECNLGLFGNFNRCGELASGRYVLFLCSDDRLAPGFLATAVAAMEREPRAALLSSRGQMTAPDGQLLGRTGSLFPSGLYDGASVTPAWFWVALHYGSNPLNYPSGILIRRDALRAALPFRAELGAPADVDLFLRCLRHGDLIVLDDIGCFITHHSEQEGLIVLKREPYARYLIGLVKAFRPDLEAAGLYHALLRQTGASALGSIVRAGRNGPGIAELARSFELTWHTILIAAVRRLVLQAIKSVLQVQFTPYLRPAMPANQAKTVDNP